MISDLIKAVAVLLIASALIIVLRSKLQEYAFLLTVAVVVVVLIYICNSLLKGIFELRMFFEQASNTSLYFATALKALGISYISGFAADVCRDFGLSSLAFAAETAGKITVFALSIPLALSVMDAALKFTGI